ncbi:MAG: prepilin-type N-terminal cleavage/methylation domain-containing protein [Planctomycetales bacterium]|nr:prepilin-type N-terminal cleavage/methylation domain-containing protein [Planctomycetales bacterium]
MTSSAGHGRRRAVTLLEVLVSMGVMSVGLLGVAALIPLGRMELAQANIMDNASTIGRWAFRDLMVHGYLQPEMWVDGVTGLQVTRASFNSTPATDPYSLQPNGQKSRFVTMQNGATVPPFAPIVIDPLMLAPRFVEHTRTSGTAETNHRIKCSLFPYSLTLPGAAPGMPETRGDVPRLARVSVRTYPIDTYLSLADAPQFIMRNDVASRFFKSNDDLVVQVPKNKSRRPVQVFTQTTTTNSNVNVVINDGRAEAAGNELRTDGIAFRKFRGEMSWFIVAEPSVAESYNQIPENAPAAAGPVGSITTTKHYRVWTVVCHQRDLRDVSSLTLADQKGIGERMVYVDFLDRNTARIRCGGLTNEGAAGNALSLKAGQFIAVMGRYDDPILRAQRCVMEWYRITGVADAPTNIGNNMWYREVTLVGREFSGLGFTFQDEDATTFPDLNMTLNGQSAAVQPMTGFGILISGAVGVYEKSMYVDRPSLWSIRY